MESIIDWWDYQYRKKCVHPILLELDQRNAVEQQRQTAVYPNLSGNSNVNCSNQIGHYYQSDNSLLKFSQNDHQIVFKNFLTVSNDNNLINGIQTISMKSSSQTYQSKCTYPTAAALPAGIFNLWFNTGSSWKFTMKYLKIILIIFLLFVNVLSGMNAGNGIDQIDSNAIHNSANLSAFLVKNNNDNQRKNFIIQITNDNYPK